MRARLAMAALAAAIVASVVWAAPPAAAKSFEIVAIDVDATLRPDASMAVVERITYAFHGEFHNGHRGIPAGDGYAVTDLRVTDGSTGEPLPVHGPSTGFTWRFDARDEVRTFAVAYTVLGAARVGPDVGELYWKFVGDDHPGVGRVTVAVRVPGDGLDVRAWAHGPLHGEVRLDGPIVRLAVAGVPAGRFVEARVTAPAGVFSVAPSGDARLPRVLAEEQRWADEANTLREREERAAARREQVRDVLAAGIFVPVLFGWAVFTVLFLRYGREHGLDGVGDAPVGEYVREPPDDPPAFVSMLRNWGAVQPSVLSATIVDLAQRGYLTIQEVREDRRFLPDRLDWRFTATGAPRRDAAPLSPSEQRILSRLFAQGPTVTQREFTAWCRRHRTTASRWWDAVKADLGREFRQRGYIEGGRGLVFAANVVTAVAVVGIGVLTLVLGVAAGLLAVLSGVVQLALTPILRRRTPLGRRRVAEWDGFERFLRDFSQLEEAPVGHLVLWERYLVYAVALGVTATVARALAARIPAEAAGSGFAAWYTGPHGGPGALHSIGSFAEFSSGFGKAVVGAAAPSSSGSGGGGGFSGGGGGGGGGGSVGAS